MAVAVIRGMDDLFDSIAMETLPHMQHGLGCTKLVLPNSALVGRTLLSFAPTFRIRTVLLHGVLTSLILCWMVMLDEGGTMQIPPTGVGEHLAFTTSEITIITTSLIQKALIPMADADWALSPTFLRLIKRTQRADEVQLLLDDALSHQSSRSERRQQKLLLASSTASSSTCSGTTTTL